MIKAIIFDCFGVIVGKGFEYTYTQAGGDPKADRQFIDDMLNQANLGLISEVEFNESMANRLGKTLKEWHEAIIKAEEADEDLLSYVVNLKKKYKTAILSNSNKGVLKQKVGDHWLAPCFNEIVVSAEVGLTKPSLDIYRLTASRLGVEANECIFIDDHELFVRAAEQIGMHGILYKDLNDLKRNIDQIASH